MKTFYGLVALKFIVISV